MTGTPLDPPVEGSERSAFRAIVGLRFEEITATRVTARADLGPEHHQPFGIVHGGVYAAIVEETASVGASVSAEAAGLHAVGVHNSTSFVRSLSHASVHVVAEPIHQGRTQQLWQVTITHADDGRLVATGQLRLQHIEPRA